MTEPDVRDHFVYWMFDSDDRCLYVGMTRQPEKRWQQHRSTKPAMVAEVAYKRQAGPFDMATARRLEREQHEDLNPKYVAWFGDSNGYSLNSKKVVLRHDGLQRLRDAANITTNSQLAARMGINPSQVSRTLNGKCEVGNKFMASLLRLFGVQHVADLFDVVPNVGMSAS